MTTKCWFVLRQTHYPPPELPEFGVGVAKGPICLGHIIPDLEHLDNIINTKETLKFSADMQIYPSTAWHTTWEASDTDGIGLDGAAGAPVAAAAGLELHLSAGVAFKKSVHNSDQFEKLETFIVQPTAEYVDDIMDDPQVARYVENHAVLGLSKSLFLITGIIIARGSKTSRVEIQKRDFHGGPGIDFAGISEASLDLKANHEMGTSTAAMKRSDFVWAIRLAKISKGVLDRKWSHATFSKGASFGVNDGEDLGDQLVEALAEEGIKGIEKVSIGKSVNHVFLVQPPINTSDPGCDVGHDT